jgi:hypothetical protein
MKTTAAISIAALVAALAVTPVMALDLNVGANAGVSASSDDDNTNAGLDLGVDVNANAGGDDGEGGDLGVDTSATGSIGGSVSDESLDLDSRLDLMLRLISESDYDDSSFSAWVDGSSTVVVNTDDIFDADGQAQIDAALQANLDEHDDLNAAINANASLKAWLDSNDIDAASVIAIDVSADGSVHVYEG